MAAGSMYRNAAGLLAAIAACEGPTAPTRGALAVHVTTTGQDINPDGYAIRLDSTLAGRLDANGTLQITSVAPGSVTVELVDVLPNCQVGGQNPRSVTIVAGDTSSVAFAVSCSPWPRLLNVTVTTSGAKQDPNGYVVVIDGTDSLDLSIFTSALVSVGHHVVELRDVANNCTVSPSARREFDMPVDGQVDIGYDVACLDLPGALAITTVTTGRSPDGDGYSIRAGAGAPVPLPSNGVTVLANLTSDTTTLELLDNAANCGPLGTAPQTVAVPPADTLAIRIDVVCGAGSALAFDSGRFAQGPPLSELASTWTVEFWFWSNGPREVAQEMLGQWGVFYVSIWRAATGQFWVSPSAFTDSDQVATSLPLEDSIGQRWRHFAMSFDHGTVTIFVDGEQRLQFQSHGTTTAHSSLPFTLGTRITGGTPTTVTSFTGRLDEVRIWNTVRTPSEIEAWRDQLLPPGQLGLVAYWSLEAGSGQAVLDVSGNGHNLQLGATAAADSADAMWVTPGRP